MTHAALVAVTYLASSGAPLGRPTSAGANSIPVEFLDRPVLVIEDEAMIAWMLESLLQDLGFGDITIVSDGEHAMAEAERHAPALIVSDINLGSDALDGVGAVAAITRGAVAYVVFITAYASDDARRRIATEIPGALLLRKPIAAGQLEDAIRQFTGISRTS